MTRKTLGLYDPEGNAIIEYDGFDYKDYKFMYISTGWGSTGTWKINANYDNFNYDKDPSEALDKLKGRLGTFLDDNLSRHSDWVKKINDKVKKISKRMLAHHEKLAKKCDDFGPLEEEDETERRVFIYTKRN